jgi:hypothetical protein
MASIMLFHSQVAKNSRLKNIAYISKVLKFLKEFLRS